MMCQIYQKAKISPDLEPIAYPFEKYRHGEFGIPL